MKKKLVIPMLLFCTASFGQAVGPGGVPGAGGSSGFPITFGSTPIAASSTTSTINGLTLVGSPSVNNVKYLSCSSELGAQVNSAVTALEPAGGIIVFPNCTTATWTTGTSQLPPNISFEGYGQRATQITCSVAGDCLDIHEPVDWTTNSMAVGSVISGFTMTSTGATGEVLIHGEGLNGFSIHDIALNGAGTTGTDGQTTCLEFENTTADSTFTEENNTYNVRMGSECYIPVLFNQDSGDTDTSFGYNTFQFSVAPDGVYGIVFNGAGNLYNGSLRVMANHHGAGGGVLQFNNSFNTTTGGPTPNEHFYITAEENGGTGASVIDMNSTGDVQVQGWVNNGASNAIPLANTCTGNCTWPNWSISNAAGMNGVDDTGFLSSLATDTNYSTQNGATPRLFLCPNVTGNEACQIAVGHDATSDFNQAVFDNIYTSSGSSANRGALGMIGQFALEWDKAGILYPQNTIVMGGSSYTPSTSMISATGNWAFGTNFSLDNTSAGGENWSLVSEGAGSAAGAFGIAGPTAWTLALFNTGATSNAVLTPSGSTYSFSTAASIPTSSAQNAGISSPSAGVIDMDGSTIGDKGALLQAAAIGSGVSGNTDLRGHLTLSSGTATYSFAKTYTVAPTCVATDTTSAAAVKASATTTVLTLTGTGTDVLNYICAD